MIKTAEALRPARIDTPLQLVCTEVWGGNQLIDAPVQLPGVRGRVYSRPCTGGRGGDVHYLSVCGSGLITRMCLADVAGHGAAVATVGAELHHLLRRYMNWPDQRLILRRLNERLAAQGFESLATAATVTYYPVRRWLSVSYAGHPPAWFYSRAEQRWTLLTAEPAEQRRGALFNLPLAVDKQTRFTRRSVRVNQGDRLLVLTDGVLEAPDQAGGHFAATRLEGLLQAQREASTDELVTAILAELARHTGEADFRHDDLSLLVVEFDVGRRAPSLWTGLKNRILRPRGNSNSEPFRRPRATAGA